MRPATSSLRKSNGEVVAQAQVWRAIRDGTVTFDVAGSVAPAWRRRGIGRALFRENLRRAAERAAAEPAGAPIRPRELRRGRRDGPQGDSRGSRLRGRPPFLPDAGRRSRRRPGRAAPRRPRDPAGHAGPAPRDLRRRDRGVPRPLGSPRDRPTSLFRIDVRPAELDTGLWVVAWDGDEIAGVVQNWIWPEENEQLGVKRGWLEHISVRRPWRRRGLARALTAAVAASSSATPAWTRRDARRRLREPDRRARPVRGPRLQGLLARRPRYRRPLER